MAKFNIVDRRRFDINGPLRTTAARTVTHEGAAAWVRDTKSELFALAVTNFVGENTFYDNAADRDERYAQLARQVALTDPQWLVGFIRWLRTEGLMRSAPLVAATEAVHARLAAGRHGHNRQMIDAALHRPDEPAELLAYWRARFGRPIPAPVKRGIGDACARLYSERAALKYDTAGRPWRHGDVLRVCHPKPPAAQRSLVYGHLVRRRRTGDQAAPEQLRLIRRHADLMAVPLQQRRDLLRTDPQRIIDAGFTWESLAGWLGGPMDSTAWEAIIPAMGLMALARNLRNFDNAGVSDAVAAQVAARIGDPEQVYRSRMLPYRWLAAHRQAHTTRWTTALDRAATASLAAIPDLGGRTLVLVDTSASMTGTTFSRRSTMAPADAAAVFGVALAMRGQADLHGFADGVFAHRVDPQGSLLGQVQAFTARTGEVGHGTRAAEAVRATYTGHDRVVLISDMQTMAGGHLDAAVPAHVPLYAVNLGGYRGLPVDTRQANRVELAGLSDATFSFIDFTERGQRAAWPWQRPDTEPATA